MNSSIRCFVAMAVGRADTDRVYDKYILPTLRSLGINAIFMGRLEHNDDIDKRIIHEIEQCDFAIADLTYVRPSVYFEAGYAQRTTPVIYTCRADHLGQGTGDLRVHFDLLMRNIIPWADVNDSGFAAKLSKRIKIVVAPLVRAKQQVEQNRAHELQFQNLPLSSRLQLVADKFRIAVKRCGYASLVEPDDFSPWVGRTTGAETLDICRIVVQPTFTLRNIKDHTSVMSSLMRSRFDKREDEGYKYKYKTRLYMWQQRWPGQKPPKPSETKNVKNVVAKLVLCSLQKIPRQRVMAALPYSTPSAARTLFRWRSELRRFQLSLPMLFSVYIADPIVSLVDASEKSRKLSDLMKAKVMNEA